MGRLVFVLLMLAGGGLIVARTHWFLPATFGCFHCFDNSRVILDAVSSAAAVFVMVLTPAALAFGLWWRLACLRKHGTTSVTRDQSIALIRNHLGLRVLLNATTLLALIAGGLIVQLGYMISL